jgi:hypothetical protein
MKTLTSVLLSIFFASFGVHAGAETPRVEMDFGYLAAGDWVGKRFRDIVPPDRIKRIVRLTEHGFAHHNNALPNYRSIVQGDYDALIAHLIASKDAAANYGLDAREGTGATLLILTADQQIFWLEVLIQEQEISAVTINSTGRGARIPVKGFRRAVPPGDNRLK